MLLIDLSGQVAAARRSTSSSPGAISGFATRLEGATDPTRVAGCSVCVVADRAGQTPSEWRRDDGLETVARFARDAGAAPLVFAGTGQESLMRALAREAGVQRRRLIGSAPEALAAAVRAMVAIEAGCSVTEVSLSVLGARAAIVVPWVEASIAGYALEKVLTQAQLARVEARLPRLWPPGPYTLGLAAADVLDAIIQFLAAAALRHGRAGGRIRRQGSGRRDPSLPGPIGHRTHRCSGAQHTRTRAGGSRA